MSYDVRYGTIQHQDRTMLANFKQSAREWLLRVPSPLKRRHISIAPDRLESLKGSIQRWQLQKDLDSPPRADFHEHLLERTESDRRLIVPWLDAHCRLDGLRILEVGCGSGCSTVALAEQGAQVTGIDLDAPALQVARERCELYGVTADFRELNAADAASSFAPRDFGLIIFFACLEHMTVPERMKALSALWNLLPSGAWLAVVETPNRLWYLDFHTSLLPYFNWLPDDLAFAYSKFSQREPFKSKFRVSDPVQMLRFQRQGRGVSYHEFDLAIGTHEVFSSFSTFYGLRHTLLRSPRAHRFKSLIKSLRPDLHDGWFEPSLDLLFKKV